MYIYHPICSFRIIFYKRQNKNRNEINTSIYMINVLEYFLENVKYTLANDGKLVQQEGNKIFKIYSFSQCPLMQCYFQYFIFTNMF